VVGWVDQTPVKAGIAGVLRGLLHDGLRVCQGMKIGDVDPRAAREHCFTVSDKSLAIAGGVLEAALYLLRGQRGASAQNVSGV
jgi:xanthine dehydrogenase accessory factor